MFDTHNYRTGDSYSRVDITEKRAPTDESIRLLHEMQQKALQDVLAHVKIDNNEFKASWWLMRDDYSDYQYVYCKFKLNSKDYDFKFSLPCKYVKIEDITLYMLEKVQEEIAKILTIDRFRNYRIIQDIKEEYAQKI
jgi:hypothetical protein